MKGDHAEKRRASLWGMPPNVAVAGIVSFFMDVSSEMVYAVTPLFLEALGVSKAAIGALEGTAEATAALALLMLALEPSVRQRQAGQKTRASS